MDQWELCLLKSWL